MKIIINLDSNTVAGMTNDAAFTPANNQIMQEAPEDFDIASASEWSYDGKGIVRDLTIALDRAKAAAKQRIKSEAARLIAAYDWKLARARERDEAGWGALSGIDTVLAERESVRRSSSAAEQAVDALTDMASVHGFSWSVTAITDIPRRLTQAQFMARFTAEEVAGILAASDTHIDVRVMWEKFRSYSTVNLESDLCQSGVRALGIAGLLSAGRADEILG